MLDVVAGESAAFWRFVAVWRSPGLFSKTLWQVRMRLCIIPRYGFAPALESTKQFRVIFDRLLFSFCPFL